MNQPIRRALLSVSDKRGIVELAKALQKINCEIISTGGTQAVLRAENIATTDISAVTGNVEAFGGRMKTISFAIGSALLFDRERDAAEAEKLQIKPIDLVVCNLYPFAEVAEKGGDWAELIENIDIGGPTMIRAAAKNYRGVTVLTSSEDYAPFLLELQANEGAISYEFRRNCMLRAFAHTADYDAMVSNELQRRILGANADTRLVFEQARPLRYGENPHQKASFYRKKGTKYSLHDAEFLQGKELSYNNLLDAQSAIETVLFTPENRAAVTVVKHNNPCGLAQADDLPTALRLAWAGDTVSAFGSVIAFTKSVDLATVEFFALQNADKSQRKFVEVLIAPDYSPQALEYLQGNKNLRVLRLDFVRLRAEQGGEEYRFLSNALLVQGRDEAEFSELRSVVGDWDAAGDEDLIRFGLRAVRSIKSNAIVLVQRGEAGALQLVGMGAGQPNRLNSIRLAAEKAQENGADLSQCVLISDAFFPFEDNAEQAQAFGIKRLVQPGGSIRDPHIIERCRQLGLSMVFSGLRHFKH